MAGADKMDEIIERKKILHKNQEWKHDAGNKGFEAYFIADEIGTKFAVVFQSDANKPLSEKNNAKLVVRGITLSNPEVIKDKMQLKEALNLGNKHYKQLKVEVWQKKQNLLKQAIAEEKRDKKELLKIDKALFNLEREEYKDNVKQTKTRARTNIKDIKKNLKTSTEPMKFFQKPEKKTALDRAKNTFSSLRKTKQSTGRSR